jgi:hypothetical protein
VAEAPGGEAAPPGEAAGDEAAPPAGADAAGEPGAAAGEPAAAPPDTRPRIGSVRYISWIYATPSKRSRGIGYIREGTSIPLKSAEKVKGEGCRGGWFAADPYGFACLDSTTTLDLQSPLFAALAQAAPSRAATAPYRYAFSDNAPMYSRIPTPAQQLKIEGPPERRKPVSAGPWARSHQELAVAEPIKASDAVPGFLVGAAESPRWGKPVLRKWIPAGSMVAYSHAFEAEGRVWLLSPDLTLVPADRVRAFRPSTFHGVALAADGPHLPLAWARHTPVARYQRGEGGAFAEAGEKVPPRTWVQLTGERVEEGRRAFLATSQQGVWLLESDVSVVRAREKLPASLGEQEKWIEVRIHTGTLVAYVGLTPVFASLVSPGAGGVAAYGSTNAQLVKASATPLGIYRMNWKTRAAAMSPEPGEPQKFWIADVPDTQYFRPPFALHTAYWHEDFGMPKSAGCVNVSPQDGKFLFSWTDPPIPEGWQGVAPSKEGGPGTMIVVVP